MNTPKLRTITVQFPNAKKEYSFNIYMVEDSLNVGDTIYLPRYSSNVKITRIFQKAHIYVAVDNYGGIIYFAPIADCITKPIKIVSWTGVHTNTLQKPCKELSLKDAQELYKQGGEIRKVALKYYSEEELNPIKPLTLLQLNKRAVLDKLQKLANTYNGLWTKEEGVEGYFLHYCEGCWNVLWHQRVTYPGVIYFKSREAAYKALQQLPQTEREYLRA